MDNKDYISVTEDGLTSASYLTFMIDDVLTDPEYIHTPSGNDTWQYNIPIYSNTAITPYGPHKLTIMNGGDPGHSIFLFDYVIYT
jgi:hypothetical protein